MPKRKSAIYERERAGSVSQWANLGCVEIYHWAQRANTQPNRNHTCREHHKRGGVNNQKET